MNQAFFNHLAEKYTTGEASDAEVQLLEAYYLQLEESGDEAKLTEEELAVIRERIFKLIQRRKSRASVHSIRSRKALAVAASLAILIGLGVLYSLFFHGERGDNIQTSVNTLDLPPGRDAAILTLANGQQIYLDSASGAITAQNGVQIINSDGVLLYDSPNEEDGEVVYNTVTTARGNQYQVVLSDGSRVWLNSGSSLKYPVTFKGDTRTVHLAGEAYFEVATRPMRNGDKQPFRVISADQSIEVLGTGFNVNSYEDEEAVVTTLLEGSIRLHPQGGNSVLMVPGQQASYYSMGKMRIDDSADLEKAIAWKNGWFEFDQLDLSAILRQVSRWYDVEIAYENKPGTEKFGGRLSRRLPISSVIELLEANRVECRLEAKTLFVKTLK